MSSSFPEIRPARRSASAITFGILNIVFGVLGLLCAAYFSLNVMTEYTTELPPSTTSAGSSPKPPRDFMTAAMEAAELKIRIAKLQQELYPFILPMKLVATSTGFLLSVLLVVSGVGLLNMKSWGRKLAITYAVLSLLDKIYVLVVNILDYITIKDVIGDIVEKRPSLGLYAAQLQSQLLVMAIIFFVLTIIYPIIVFVFMMLPGVRAAFRGEGLPTTQPDNSRRDPLAGNKPPDGWADSEPEGGGFQSKSKEDW